MAKKKQLPSSKSNTKKQRHIDRHQILKIRATKRRAVRKQVVKQILAEQRGHLSRGQKVVTRYRYDVEVLRDGRKVYLTRPTFLNKGIDFQVWVERLRDGKDRRPSHPEMVHDLEKKASEKPRQRRRLLKAVLQVWNGQSPDKVLNGAKFSYASGYPIDLTLKVLKWLFIEQDLTYWNYDGRMRLRLGIEDVFSSLDE